MNFQVFQVTLQHYHCVWLSLSGWKAKGFNTFLILWGKVRNACFTVQSQCVGPVLMGGLNPTVLSSWKYSNCSTEVCTLPAEFLHLVGAACAWVNMWNDIKIIRLKNTKKQKQNAIQRDCRRLWSLLMRINL